MGVCVSIHPVQALLVELPALAVFGHVGSEESRVAREREQGSACCVTVVARRHAASFDVFFQLLVSLHTSTSAVTVTLCNA